MVDAKKKAKGDKKKGKKKKEKAEEPIEYPEVSSHKRPEEVSPEFYCATCLAIT